ncbi:rhodanese-like domain-containing protein [Alsobacter metallidurans]|uniref:Rhodanese-like domain-containing protein n=1 Tax=Alsobacter metallidurans TaxID=340221 RepID=A0A917MK20_9HYPH|nr:rhodanese-like domain-containing protein [Alsobacter metallidurans]GGH34138.1 rhodanese-like domain-containing protein [Alsobacter metallidurans]
MARTSKDMLADANASVQKLAPAEAAARIGQGDVLVVDIRDSAELQATGKLEGSLHVPRGSLEFKADPENPMYDPAFQFDRPILIHCAAGGRAALAGKTLQDMGYTNVINVGGFKDLVEAGVPVEKK